MSLTSYDNEANHVLLIGVAKRDSFCAVEKCSCTLDKECSPINVSCECPCTSSLEFDFCRSLFPHSRSSNTSWELHNMIPSWRVMYTSESVFLTQSKKRTLTKTVLNIVLRVTGDTIRQFVTPIQWRLYLTAQLYCTCKHFNLSSRLRVDTGKFLFRSRIWLCREWR